MKWKQAGNRVRKFMGISKKSPGVPSLATISQKPRNTRKCLSRHTQNEDQEDTSFYVFVFCQPHRFYSWLWLFYLLNQVNFLHIIWGLGCPRVSWPVARLPAHLQLNDTVTLDSSKDSGRTVVSRGCMLSGVPLPRLFSIGSRQGGEKESEEGNKMWTAKC